MKKLFHRKKASAPSSPEQTPPRNRTGNTDTDTGLRTSRYESTTPASLPQTGQFPLKGNNSSISVHGRRSDTYSHGQTAGAVESNPRPSSSSPYYGSLPAPRVTSASYNNTPRTYHPAERPSDLGAADNYQRKQNAGVEDPLTQSFSNLHFNTRPNNSDHDDFPLRQHRGTRSSATDVDGRDRLSNSHERYLYGEEKSSGIRMVGPTQRAQQPTQPDDHSTHRMPIALSKEQGRDDIYNQSPSHPGIQSSSHELGDEIYNDTAVRRKNSIPRKQVPHNVPNVHSTHQLPVSSSLPPDRDHRAIVSSVQPNSYEGNHLSHHEGPSLDFSNYSQPSAQEVVTRAQRDTYDTQVVEKVAPAVVHERVHQDVHHIREEIITKEIHNHDVYHRILPIIDVEVLPPRHFLPVEGGGLVEISGKEVPGRGNNWVIAETASKIPSDQRAPKGTRPFTARKFLGAEGDAAKYDMPDGYQKTEQTWVHQPELETGGRDSGQTWPMEFGAQPDSKTNREHKASKSSRPRHSRKSLEQPSQQPRLPQAGL